MTNNKANKSKILALILGLTMCLALMLGIVFASGATTAFADGETDSRIPISTVTATSNIDEVVGYGKVTRKPTFTITDDSKARFSSVDWQKYDGSEWKWSSDDVFAEGKYRVIVQIYINSTTHVLDENGVTLTVNGENWTQNGGVSFGDDYSYAWFYSKEYDISAPIGTPVGFIKNDAWDLKKVYQGRAIPTFSVASGATGGTKPYTFSKVSGPSWITVANDGTVSGTPTEIGANENLVIRVTDSMPTTAEITLSVADTLLNPDDRAVVSTVTATATDIQGEIVGYGKVTRMPTFTITDDSKARFGTVNWQKYDGSEWKWNEDTIFVEGKYRVIVQIRIDVYSGGGTTHVLDKNGVTLTVNGEKWTQNGDVSFGDDYSYAWFYSKEYEVLGATNITETLVPVADLVKVYSGAAQEPTFGGTLVLGTDYEVSYAMAASGELGSDGKPVGAGSYSVTVTGKGAYKGSFTKDFVIAKADGQGAPILIGYAPTTVGGSDGKITGTTKDMEYDVDSSFTNPTDCTDGETTGLTEGVYFVRIKETDNYKASATAQVEVRLYNVTVEDGAGTVVTKHRTGDTVTITVNKPTGKALNKWVYWNVTIPDVTKETITFEMPNCDVRLRAVFEDVEYSITVTNGTTTLSKATYQTEVTVKANEPDADMNFDKWKVTGITLSDEDLAKSTLTFKMPAENVTFEATYLSVTKYGIVIVDGTKDKEVAKAGETVTITANPAPTGKVFDKWTCETAGVTIEFASATSKQTTFVMPASEITIKAHFRNIDDAPSVEIKVNGGTGAGTYKEGDSVTVTANNPAEGKEFVGWQDESGKIVSTKKEYTFNVNGETTLTAVYEDAPVEKEGLSGGQIAGIVIGSVLLAGIGGFAIFWFAVKKKTFADLITAIKALFAKKK